jgi:hypothetical protein
MNGTFAQLVDDTDVAIRSQWAAGRTAEAIRQDLAPMRIGVIGERVRALRMPLRDHNCGLLPRDIAFEPLSPALGTTRHELKGRAPGAADFAHPDVRACVSGQREPAATL